MAKPGTVDIALHYLPERGQYRFRFLYYGSTYIRGFYHYTSSRTTRRIHIIRMLGKSFRNAAVVVLFIVGGFISATIILAIPIALIYGAMGGK